MTWTVDFYPGVEDVILAMPPKIQARMLRLLELIEIHGRNLGMPHTMLMGNELFELRAKAKEGIGRALFCYMNDRRVFVLHAFVKKSKKTPKKDLKLAGLRMREVRQND